MSVGCVPLCKNDSRTENANPCEAYFSFPSDPKRRRMWIVKIRLDEGSDFKVTKNTLVCSDHFEKTDFLWTPVRKRLRPGAVHSKFVWSRPKVERRPLHRIPPQLSSADENPTSENIHPCDHDPDRPGDAHVVPHVADTTAAVDDLASRLQAMRIEIETKDQQIQKLEKAVELERFGIHRFGSDDSLIIFYTGFPTYNTLTQFFHWIEPKANTMTSAYYVSSETVSLAGRPRCMLLIDELFMFLCRLRLGLLEQDLSVRFNCSVSTVSRKFITWTNFLYFVLGQIPIWLRREDVDRLMPAQFKDTYPSTRVIIDCTEIRTERPSSLVINSQCYSNYKSTTTFKALVGIAPHGAVTFISPLYTGSMSDIEITKLCGICELVEQGDSVMADKGFLVHKLFEKHGATVNIPPLLGAKGQFSTIEIIETERIASLRIHVERAIRRIKENHIFDSIIPLTMTGSMNQLLAVACLLSNMRGPLL